MLKSKKENQLKVTVSSWLIGSGRPGRAPHFSLGRLSHTKEMNGTFNTSVISGSRETGESRLRATSAPAQRKGQGRLQGRGPERRTGFPSVGQHSLETHPKLCFHTFGRHSQLRSCKTVTTKLNAPQWVGLSPAESQPLPPRL